MSEYKAYVSMPRHNGERYAKLMVEQFKQMVVERRECYTCIHSEDAPRYDPDDDSELYTLMKCNLHGHVTDWPWPCEDWEGVDE